MGQCRRRPVREMNKNVAYFEIHRRLGLRVFGYGYVYGPPNPMVFGILTGSILLSTVMDYNLEAERAASASALCQNSLPCKTAYLELQSYRPFSIENDHFSGAIPHYLRIFNQKSRKEI